MAFEYISDEGTENVWVRYNERNFDVRDISISMKINVPDIIKKMKRGIDWDIADWNHYIASEIHYFNRARYFEGINKSRPISEEEIDDRISQLAPIFEKEYLTQFGLDEKRVKYLRPLTREEREVIHNVQEETAGV